MVSSSIAELISTALVNTDVYGYHFKYINNHTMTSDENEFIELTMGNNPNGVWCPNAAMIAVVESLNDNGKSGQTSIFIWTRGASGYDESPLLDIFDKITLDDTIPYVIVRKHYGEHAKCSIEIHLEDNSPHADYVM